MHAEMERLSKWTVARAACRMYSIHPTWVVLTDNKDGFTSAQNPQQTETGTVAALVVSAASQSPCIGSSPHCTWSDPFIGAEKKAYYYTSIGAKKRSNFPRSSL